MSAGIASCMLEAMVQEISGRKLAGDLLMAELDGYGRSHQLRDELVR